MKQDKVNCPCYKTAIENFEFRKKVKNEILREAIVWRNLKKSSSHESTKMACIAKMQLLYDLQNSLNLQIDVWEDLPEPINY